ncbi:MAG TPA: hypothetical protein EYQ62_11380 [Verrucomicrobiales bacterium]|nr:hypothetical protein [Verrucomicrobiales bacterium]HIL24158.1 hypothetical protein [Verrucomicrobiota bacterium]
MAREFIPFGGDLAEPSEAPKFVRREAPGLEADELDAPAPVPVTPAEAVDLAGHIRQIIQEGGLAGEAAEKAITQIEAAVAAAPARVALPEIKITAPAAPTTEAAGEGDEMPKLATIEYEREDEIVKRIRVGCTCGETILLDCDY